MHECGDGVGPHGRDRSVLDRIKVAIDPVAEVDLLSRPIGEAAGAFD